MKFRTLVIGYSLALALFLFAHHRPEIAQAGAFHSVVDLTRSIDSRATDYGVPRQSSRSGFLPVSAIQTNRIRANSTKKATDSQTQMATRIIAPAEVAPGLWTVDQIPARRLVAPLIVLDISVKTHNRSDYQTDYQISVEDIARWERANGEIPLGAVVIARTGSSYDRPQDKYGPVFSDDAALFLVEGRKILGLGSDEPSFDDGSSRADRYALSHSVYYLGNVANLDHVPAHGAMIVVAPTKVEGRSSAPVRIMALVQ